MARTNGRTWRGLAVGVGVAAAALVAGRTGWFDGLELLTVDARMRLASPAEAPDIAVIGITQEDTLETAYGPLPWPRRRYADAIEKLRRLGARVIVFDLYFPHPSADSADDQALISAVRGAGNVILPVYAKVDPRSVASQVREGVHVLSLDDNRYLERNMPALQRAVGRTGHINLSANDPDHIFRRVPAAISLVGRGGGAADGATADEPEVFYALSLETAVAALGGPAAKPAIDARRVRGAGRSWATDPRFPGTLPVDYSGVREKVDVHAGRWRAPFGKHKSIFLYSFSEFLDDHFPVEAVTNRIVFVGSLLYERHPDVHPTPVGQQPGVIIHALATQTLLGGRYPTRPGMVVQAAITGGLVMLVAVLCVLRPFKWSFAIVPVGLAVLVGAAFGLYEYAGLVIDVVVPAFGIVAGFLVTLTHTVAVAGGVLRKRERELDTLVELGRLSSSLVGVVAGSQSSLLDLGDSDVLVPPLGVGVNGAAETVITTIREAIGAETAACYLADSRTGELSLAAACGPSGEDAEDDVADAGIAAARQAMRDRRPIIWEDDQAGGRGAVNRLLCVPMTLAGRPAGAMAFFNKQPSPVSPGTKFSRDDLRLVTTFTHQAAVSLENARLYESMHDLFLDAIKSLAAAIDAKDPYTRGHTARVAQFSAMLGRQMKLNDAEAQILHLAATLHDIGKIAIPESVLNKPSSLSADERRIIEKHPVRGAIILEPVGQLKPVIPGIRHHHERYDGTGYPDGLAGTAIPLLARVIAVADSFDAMTTDRPYRRAMTDAEALGEVERCAGTQFDPELAELFVAQFPHVREAFTAGALR